MINYLNIVRYLVVLVVFIQLSACGHKHNIHTMAERGDIKGIIKYLDNKGDIDLRTKKIWSSETSAGFTPLHFAIMGDRYDVVVLLLKRGANVDALSRDGTPLYLATNLASADIMEVLLTHGVDIDLASPKDRSLLHIAVSSRQLSAREIRRTRGFDRRTKAVGILLTHGFSVDSLDHAGRTSFLHAVERNNIPAMELLKNSGANIHIRSDTAENALFMVSTTQFKRTKEERAREYETFTWLLGNGLDRRLTNARGENLFYKNCNVKIMRDLLKDNIDLNKRNQYGNSPLHSAVRYCDFTIIEQLITAGADINVQNTAGLTPLHVLFYTRAKKTLPKEKIAAIFIDKTADINSFDENGRGYLHALMSNFKNQWAVDRLIEKKIDVNRADKNNCTALHVAMNTGRTRLLRMIKGPSFDLYQQEDYGRISTHVSFMNGLIKKLVKADADVNHQDANGQTILHIVAMNKILSQAHLKALLKLGARKDIRDNAGQLPYDLAVGLQGNQDAAKLLKTNNSDALKSGRPEIRKALCTGSILHNSQLNFIQPYQREKR